MATITSTNLYAPNSPQVPTFGKTIEIGSTPIKCGLRNSAEHGAVCLPDEHWSWSRENARLATIRKRRIKRNGKLPSWVRADEPRCKKKRTLEQIAQDFLDQGIPESVVPQLAKLTFDLQ